MELKVKRRHGSAAEAASQGLSERTLKLVLFDVIDVCDFSTKSLEVNDSVKGFKSMRDKREL